MLTRIRVFIVAVLSLAIIAPTVRGADTYDLDPAHSSLTFMIKHLDISYIHGRFNEMSANFAIDKDAPAKSSFSMSIKADSVDSGVKQRDTHLRSGDFFNVKQYPSITFQSTAVKAVKDGYEVTGDFAMHGVTKSITFTLQGGKTIELMGTPRIGFFGSLTLSRGDFGVGSPGMLGDQVYIYIGMEGTKKK